MSTRKQIAAYREIKEREHTRHLISTYGMVPIKARFPGKCGCGEVYTTQDGYTRPTPCQFNPTNPDAKIVKYRGSWWNTPCVDRAMELERREKSRYVKEIYSARKDTWTAFEWSHRESDFRRWREDLEMEPESNIRIIDRGETR